MKFHTFTDTGLISVSEDALDALMPQLAGRKQEMATLRAIIAYRKAKKRQEKLLGTAKATGLIPASEIDSTVHTTYNLTGTPTGRVSSTDPPVQNIERKGTGPLRSSFVTRFMK